MPAAVLDLDIPKVTYCDPQIASIGLTEADARATVRRCGDAHLRPRRQWQVTDPQDAGFRQAGPATGGAVVGVQMIGARVGELIGEAQLITNWEAFPSDVAGLVHAHPTQSEALGEAHLALAGKPLHVTAERTSPRAVLSEFHPGLDQRRDR